MKSIHKILLLLSIIAVVSSCKDEDKDLFNDFGQGAFVRFTKEVSPPTLSFAVPADASFSLPIEDVNENTMSYSLDMVATVSGTATTIENFLTITSFPATLTISAQTIADALSVPITDLNFGDNFAFIANTVRTDGTEFRGERPVFTAATPATDTDPAMPATLTGGNTSFNLLDGAGYRNAMAFNFTFACPPFAISDVVGTYNVVSNGLAGALGLSDPSTTREVIAGPGANQVTVVGGSVGFAGGDDLIVEIDLNSGALTLGEDGLAFPVGTAGLTFDSDYGPFAPGGLAVPCVSPATLSIPVTIACCGGVFALQLSKP